MQPRTAEARSFSPELFAFLRELREHNDREWFKARKDRYEAAVKEPALAFVEDCAHLLPGVSPHLVADERSLFRIHRDTRFAKDKSPYKTHAGIAFRHVRGPDAPALYLHLEPGHVFMGAGIWHPGAPQLKLIRDAIVARPDEWRAAVTGVAPLWTLGEGEALKRAPAGYDRDHPLVDDLKRKSFAVVSRLTQTEVTGRGFLAEWERRARAARPFMAFICSALGASY